MKVVKFDKYGPPEVLYLTEAPKPVPGNDEILVKINATTVTAGDWRMRKPDPFLARIMNGLFRPKKVPVLGFELSGVVEAVGSDVTRFKAGDEVMASAGFRFGAYAEYKCLKENAGREKGMIVLKPKNIGFNEAAAVPIGGITAVALMKQVDFGKGRKMLVYGASGSVGSYAVQIAVASGADVTAVCGPDNVEWVKALGCSRVLNYREEDFSQLEDRFDVVLEAVGKVPKSVCRKVLKKNGRFLSVMSRLDISLSDLEQMKAFVEEGSVKPVIDKVWPLEKIVEAHRYVESYHKKGNVVITVDF